MPDAYTMCTLGVHVQFHIGRGFDPPPPRARNDKTVGRQSCLHRALICICTSDWWLDLNNFFNNFKETFKKRIFQIFFRKEEKGCV